MNAELIDKLAEQAGVAYADRGEMHPSIREGYDMRDTLLRLAALVAEECAKECDALEAEAERCYRSEATAACWSAAKNIRAKFPMP